MDRCCEEFEFGNRFGFGFEFGILEMDLKFYIRNFFWDFNYIFKKRKYHSGRFGPNSFSIYKITDGLGPNHL
jgi:hypothetical protein